METLLLLNIQDLWESYPDKKTIFLNRVLMIIMCLMKIKTPKQLLNLKDQELNLKTLEK